MEYRVAKATEDLLDKSEVEEVNILREKHNLGIVRRGDWLNQHSFVAWEFKTPIRPDRIVAAASIKTTKEAGRLSEVIYDQNLPDCARESIARQFGDALAHICTDLGISPVIGNDD